MTSTTDHIDRRRFWRITRWSVAASLLALPAVAMRFTPEVHWTGGDFVAAALLIGLPLLGYEVVAGRGRPSYRLAAALALLAAFLLMWINLAVGIIGDEDNPANLMYAGVLAVAIGGAVATRGRALGLRWVMVGAAAAQLLVAAVAVIGGMGVGNPIWPLDVLGITALLTTLWLAAAGGFALATRP